MDPLTYSASSDVQLNILYCLLCAFFLGIYGIFHLVVLLYRLYRYINKKRQKTSMPMVYIPVEVPAVEEPVPVEPVGALTQPSSPNMTLPEYRKRYVAEVSPSDFFYLLSDFAAVGHGGVYTIDESDKLYQWYFAWCKRSAEHAEALKVGEEH